MNAEKVKPPVCPYCQKEMDIVEHDAYDDYFCFWQCECSDLEMEKHWNGDSHEKP